MNYVRRLTISLNGDELSALNQLAVSEKRDPRDQAVLLITSALQNLGLLNANAQAVRHRTRARSEFAREFLE